MNNWLEFRSLTITRAFENENFRSIASKFLTMLYALILTQFFYFLLQILQLFLAPSSPSFNYHLYTAILVILFLLASLGMLLLYKRTEFTKNHSKYLTGVPILLNLIGVNELYFAYADSTVYQSPVDCGLIHFEIFLVVVLLSLPKLWYVKSGLALACSAYILLRKAYAYSVLLSLSNASLCLIITIALSLGFYYIEKQEKENFLSHYQVFNHEKILKSLLNGLPEGIIILDQTQKPFYCNQAMHTVLNTEPNEDAIIAKIQDLHINQIVEEINKHSNPLFESPIHSLINLSQSKKQNQPLESPSRSQQEVDSPGLPDSITKLKKKTRIPSNPENPNGNFSRLLVGKTSFQNSQDYTDHIKTRGTIGTPKKRTLEASRVRLKEESINLTENLSLAKAYQKRSSSGFYHLEANFRLEFNDQKFKGYASNPLVSQDFVIFNLYGEYIKTQGDLIIESEKQEIAYEIKVREMQLEDHRYKVLIVSDISIREKLANLEENSKFKNLMFASLSHEFRTPLNGIYSMLEVATKQVRDSAIVKSYLKPALNNAHMLLFLINDMLDYSTVLTGKLFLSLQEFSLIECFEEMLDLIKPQAELKNISVHLKISPKAVKKICSDKARIQQVLVNLLTNATKFTSSGSITISLDSDPTRIHVTKISVEDTGVGMNNLAREKLMKLMNQFDMSEKISSNSSGAGMGLMMSQALALALGPPGGDNLGIQIQSEYGKGSIFKFSIYNHNTSGTLEDIMSVPSLPDERSPTSLRTDILTTIFIPKQGIKHIHNIGKKRSMKNVYSLKSLKTLSSRCECPKVLIVDDTSYNIIALQAQLDAQGVASEIAFNGQAAIDKVCEAYQKRDMCCKGYKIVFMDFNMPVLDGYEAARRLRLKQQMKEIEPITIIGCTAYTDKSLLDQGLFSGMDECLTKPVKAKDLKRVLEDYGVVPKTVDP